MNFKQNQRDALTKEKQILIGTGGGPSIKPIAIDPDVLAIAPDLMKTVPIIYSLNLDDGKVKGMYLCLLKVLLTMAEFEKMLLAQFS